MRLIKEAWFIGHTDWYILDEEKGYVPTELAPPEAVEAMKKLNEMSEEEIA